MNKNAGHTYTGGAANHPDQATLLAYVAGSLDPAVHARVSQHLANCAMCAEAVEGLRQGTVAQHAASLQNINNRLARRVRPAVPLWQKAAAMAAAAIFLFFISWLLLPTLMPGNKADSLALEAPAPAQATEDTAKSTPAPFAATPRSTPPAQNNKDLPPTASHQQQSQEANNQGTTTQTPAYTPAPPMPPPNQTTMAEAAEEEAPMLDLMEQEGKGLAAAPPSGTAPRQTTGAPAGNFASAPAPKMLDTLTFKMELAQGTDTVAMLNSQPARPLVATAQRRQATQKKAAAPAPAAALAAAPADTLRKPLPHWAMGKEKIDWIKIEGQVIDARTGKSMENVTLRVPGAYQGTQTNEEGYFELPILPGDTILLLTYLGYVTDEMPINGLTYLSIGVDLRRRQDRTFLINDKPTSVQDRLDRRYFQVNTNTANSNNYVNARPVISKKEYSSYLQQYLQYPAQAKQQGIEGNVKVRFVVQPDGRLTNFEVVSGPDYGCHQEAIRLVKEGPYWRPAVIDGIRKPAKVRLKITFSLPQ